MALISEAKTSAVACTRPVERLDAEPVAYQQQTPSRTIPQTKREHSAEAMNAVVTPLLVRVDDGLGVGPCPVLMTRSLELRTHVAWL